VLAVREGATCESSFVTTCNDDACGLQSYVEFFVFSGATYWIFVDSYSEAGSYTVSVGPASPSGAFLAS
jgi:hypothetical protein